MPKLLSENRNLSWSLDLETEEFGSNQGIDVAQNLCAWSGIDLMLH